MEFPSDVNNVLTLENTFIFLVFLVFVVLIRIYFLIKEKKKLLKIVEKKVQMLQKAFDISEDAIFSVPTELKEASLALGATKWETITRVILPASLSGITTAIILGMSRAIGETMVVLMVAGGAAIVPISLFDPVRPMPASIAAEMAEAPFRGDHYHALFATAVVLFFFTLLFNLTADHISHKYKQVGASTL